MTILKQAALAAIVSTALIGAAQAQQSIHNRFMDQAPDFGGVNIGGSIPVMTFNGQSSAQAMPDFADGFPIIARQGALVVAGGGSHSGALQPANSLPAGFADGSPQNQYAQSVQRWFAEQADTAARTAQHAPVVPGQPHS